MAGHSPAPFQIGSKGGNGRAVLDANGHRIANLAFAYANISAKVTNEECEANQRLFAAAPDLLAALKALTQQPPVEGYGDVIAAKGPAWDMAFTAIAKAEGASR